MTNVTRGVKRELICDHSYLFGFGVDDRWYRVQKFRFASASCVTIATSGHTGFYRVSCVEFGGKRSCASYWPDCIMRRYLIKIRRRLGGVMAFYAEDRAANIVLAPVMFYVIKRNFAEFCLLSKYDHLRDDFFLFVSRFRQSLSFRVKSVDNKKARRHQKHY